TSTGVAAYQPVEKGLEHRTRNTDYRVEILGSCPCSVIRVLFSFSTGCYGTDKPIALYTGGGRKLEVLPSCSSALSSSAGPVESRRFAKSVSTASSSNPKMVISRKPFGVRVP